MTGEAEPIELFAGPCSPGSLGVSNSLISGMWRTGLACMSQLVFLAAVLLLKSIWNHATQELMRGWQPTAVLPVHRWKGSCLPQEKSGPSWTRRKRKGAKHFPIFSLWFMYPPCKINTEVLHVPWIITLLYINSKLYYTFAIKPSSALSSQLRPPCRCPTLSSSPPWASLVPSEAVVYLCHLLLCY